MATILNLPELRPAVLLDFVNSGQVDPRISFTRASAATRWNAAGVLDAVPAGVPRIDYHPITGKCLGLLVEEGKTNMSPRNTTTGAVLGVLGSGGSLPTGWTVTPKATSGLDVEVAGIGVESGLPYVDLRVFGTATAGYQAVVFGNVTGYTTNREYSGTVFAKMLSGAAGGAGSLQLQARYNNSGGSVNITGGYAPASLNGDLRAQRLLANGSTDGSATGAGQFLLVFNLPTSTVYDFRFRLAVPQLESGPASSVIFTDGAAATRAADSAVLLLSSPVSAGALAVAATPIGWSGADARFVSLTDGTTANCAALHLSPNGNGSIASVITAAGSFQYGPAEGAILPLRRLSRALTWGQASARVATNGVLGTAGGAITLPAPMNRLDIGNRLNTQFFSGHIERCALYAARITDSQLQRITA